MQKRPVLLPSSVLPLAARLHAIHIQLRFSMLADNLPSETICCRWVANTFACPTRRLGRSIWSSTALFGGVEIVAKRNLIQFHDVSNAVSIDDGLQNVSNEVSTGASA